MRPNIILLIIVIILSVLVIFFELRPFFYKSSKNNKIEINGNKINVEIVRSPIDLARGLSGRDSLAPNEGMFFLFPKLSNYGFWMKDMKITIDIVWIKGDRVVGFVENVDPQIGATEKDLKIYYPPEPIDKVLEVIAGQAKSLNLKIGDKVL